MEKSCESIDLLSLVVIRPPGMPRGSIGPLYRASRKDKPLTYEIAKALLEERGSTIGIFTGAVVPKYLPNGENDGPLGSVVLGRALNELGMRTIIYTEEECLEVTQVAAKAIGADCTIEKLDREPGLQHDRLTKELDIAIAIEKAGVNEKGVQHSVNGNSRQGTRAVVDNIFVNMLENGKTTIGIGDGGNEIGFGSIYEDACKIVPYGKKCRCGCEGSIVTVTATKYLYPAAISNWGAYAITAALAIATNHPEFSLRPNEEETLLQTAIKYDCRDGGTGEAAFRVDGVSGESSMAFVCLLNEIVEVTLRSYSRDF